MIAVFLIMLVIGLIFKKIQFNRDFKRQKQEMDAHKRDTQ
jgi:flagellar biogenesis protein FliO